MQGLHETLNALRDATVWSARRQRIKSAPPAPLIKGVQAGALKMLTEDAGKSWLAARGFAVPDGRCVTAEKVKDAARAVGYPVALKMMSAQLAHKSEAGAVALGLTDAQGLEDALTQMTKSVTQYDASAVTERFLVEKMSAAPVAEMIVALRSDPQFGQALVLGSGGILTELVGDAVTVLLPARAEDICAALATLRMARLLDGFRGRRPADMIRIAEQIHGLCHAFMVEEGAIQEIEINPMFIYPEHIVAIDALIHVRSQ